MTTEAKIRETFNKQFDPDSKGTHFNTFEDGYKAGYMALLNELIECGSINDMGAEKLYRLPEGVTKP